MKFTKKQQLMLQQQYQQYGGGLPTWTYVILIIIGIIIIYLLVLRSRINEFFENNNSELNQPELDQQKSDQLKLDQPDSLIYIKDEINPYEVQLVWQDKLIGSNRYLSIWQRKNKPSQNLYCMGQYATVTNNKIDGLTNDEIRRLPS